MKKQSTSGSNLQGVVRLITTATVGITNIVEDMQRRIVHPPFLPSTPIQHLITGIAGITYKSIRFTTKLVGAGLDKTLAQLPARFSEVAPSPEKEALHAALNGVIGDYLEATENPLTIPLQFRHEGQPISLTKEGIAVVYPATSGKLLLLVHGSCMNDLQWKRNDLDYGVALATELGYSPIYLRYNSGRHISTNGKELAEQLEILIKSWTVPVEQLVIIAHSMGGLVSRSAIHYGQIEDRGWVKLLQKVFFLGTPHHGAPLEQAGNYLDVLLEAIPYTKPLAKLGKIRSAGVTDLRYGNLTDEDWEGNDRFASRKDQRASVPLLSEISSFNFAAINGSRADSVKSKLVGDGLVGLDSALGRHKNPEQHLGFLEEHQRIVYNCSHVDLLGNSEVHKQLVKWLTPIVE